MDLVGYDFSRGRADLQAVESTTLLAGTLILTGTPSGVGFTRNPPVYLKSGDLLESEIDGIGRMEIGCVGRGCIVWIVHDNNNDHERRKAHD